MLAVVGTLLLSAALFIFAWARVEHQRAEPRPWLRYEIASQLVVFAILMFLAGGGGIILHVVGNYESNAISLIEGAIIVLIVALTVILLVGYWRLTRRPGSQSAADAAMGPMPAMQGSGASEGGSDRRGPDSHSRGGGRPRAA